MIGLGESSGKKFSEEIIPLFRLVMNVSIIEEALDTIFLNVGMIMMSN
jgi:hypothetical protein